MDDLSWATELDALTYVRIQSLAGELMDYCNEDTSIGLKVISVLIELSDKLDKGQLHQMTQEARKRREEEG